MRRFLLFLSVAVLFLSGYAADDGQSMERQRFTFTLDTPRGGLSGIMVLAPEGDVIKGAMVNEFGFSAVDFVYNRESRRVKLVNVIKFLDKWRVKYVLRRDLAKAVALLEGLDCKPGKNYEMSSDGSTVTLRNTRYGLVYRFSPLDGTVPRYAGPVNIWAGTDCDARVTMTPYLAPGDGNAAVIVCPGGSYFWLDRETEGDDVARWLQSAGISAFVLEYRVAGIEPFITHSRLVRRGNCYPDMLLDVQRAVSLIRCDSALYGVDPSRVGVMGFSAGGHLAVLSGERYDTFGAVGDCGVSCRPDFIASIYPVVTFTEEYMHRRSRRGIMGEGRAINADMSDSLSLERHVRSDMPPVFLMNCKDDPVVDYRNSVLLDSALTAAGVDHVYLQYPTGGHGFGCGSTAAAREWPRDFIDWLSDF